ncbi:Uncharacterised protein [Mycobacteroides abscessus subsp. abscessus]|nr:Uncharacterised protein [Mycobacteroides abscessus subsp. abscessus]
MRCLNALRVAEVQVTAATIAIITSMMVALFTSGTPGLLSQA